jgi:hypothetical protein
MRRVSAVRRKDVVDVSFQKVMAELMGDAESLETFVFDVGCIKYPEFIAMAQEHARNAALCVADRLNGNVPTGSNGERVDGKCRNAVFAQERFGLLLGHFQPESMIPSNGHLRFASFR